MDQSKSLNTKDTSVDTFFSNSHIWIRSSPVGHASYVRAVYWGNTGPLTAPSSYTLTKSYEVVALLIYLLFFSLPTHISISPKAMFRIITSRALSNVQSRSAVGAISTRSFHSPFAVLSSNSPLTSHPESSEVSASNPYQKQTEESPEPSMTISGTRTYVVSTPDPSNTHYEVPSGAFPNSAPYHNPAKRDAPQTILSSSTSASPAHSYMSTRVPTNEFGIGESAAVRFRSAPGALGERGGSDGGIGLMDEASTSYPEETLGERNPPPSLSKEAEKFGKLGVDGGWKARH